MERPCRRRGPSTGYSHVRTRELCGFLCRRAANPARPRSGGPHQVAKPPGRGLALRRLVLAVPNKLLKFDHVLSASPLNGLALGGGEARPFQRASVGIDEIRQRYLSLLGLRLRRHFCAVFLCGRVSPSHCVSWNVLAALHVPWHG
ncbi:hypothetical protein MPLA_290054 [Mesorhizobium sp. ORS 3359]|nr:hypothetical protein MPLA_290054 [Mesorhizobium sp. ORS 3359]